MLTGRDAVHRRIVDMLTSNERLPVSFHGRTRYYVGPVDPIPGGAGRTHDRNPHRLIYRYDA